MKKILILSVVSIFALSSFTSKETKKDVVKPQMWRAKCPDGTIGGYFVCDCTQGQANTIAAIMCD